MKTINNQHPSSIRCLGSNSRPLDRELTPLTTRPWFLATYIDKEDKKELDKRKQNEWLRYGISREVRYLQTERVTDWQTNRQIQKKIFLSLTFFR